MVFLVSNWDMARWIPLSLFKDLYENESELLSQDAHGKFLKRLESSEGVSICSTKGIDTSDFDQFKQSVRNPQAIVFHGWVAQNKVISETLDSGVVSGSYEDKVGILTHTLSDHFTVFISPYLTPILLKDIPSDTEKLSEYFSFATLLDKDSRPAIEAQLFKKIREKLLALKVAEKYSEEQELIELVKPLCSDAIIRSINSMSKASYSYKIEYVDEILESIRTPGCTVRFANWILKQLDNLTLNREHNRKLLELRKELARGELRVKKFDNAKSPIRWRPILTITIVLLTILTGAFLIIFKPFNKAEVYNAYENAEMNAFSAEEQKEIDSLVHVIEFEFFMDGEMVDPNVFVQKSQQIVTQNPFKNSLMEQIFSDLNKDVGLKENYHQDTCLNLRSFQRYNGVKDLTTRSASKKVVFRNESVYDLIVYVTDNKSSGHVYSMFIKKGEMVEFKMNVGDVLTSVAGNQFAQFYPPIGSKQDEKPSRNFINHFCDTDNNYSESINISLRLKSTSLKEVKFMATGKRGKNYNLADINKVAETY